MSASSRPCPWVQTRRLQLREFSWIDEFDLVQMHKDARIRQLLVDDEPLDRPDMARAFIRFVRKSYTEHPGLGIWAAEHLRATLSKEDLQRPEVREALSDEALERAARIRPFFVGWFNLMPMSGHPLEVELGSRLKPEVWGTGFAIEGGELLLEHAFNTLKLKRIFAVSHIDHKPARFVVATLGFSDQGIEDYCGTPARHYLLERDYWLAWRRVSRRKRIRHGIAFSHHDCVSIRATPTAQDDRFSEETTL